MARPNKFTEPSVLIQERVPESTKDKVLNFINDIRKPFLAVVDDIEVNEQFLGIMPENVNNLLDEIKVVKTVSDPAKVVEFAENPIETPDCGCRIENNLFKRGKGCKIAKDKHIF